MSERGATLSLMMPSIGVLTEPGVTHFDFGFLISTQARAVPLGPGDYARIPVHVDAQAMAAHNTPGRYDLHVVMTELGLRTTQPLSVELSAAMIARNARRVRPSRADGRSERRHLDDRIEQLQVFATASASLAELTLALAAVGPASDEVTRATIADVMGCSDAEALSIYHAPLQMLSPTNDRIPRELRELLRRRDDLQPEG